MYTELNTKQTPRTSLRQIFRITSMQQFPLSLILALAIWCSASASHSPAIKPEKYLVGGVYDQLSIPEFRRWVDSSEHAGFTTVRILFRWSTIQKTPNSMDYSYLDQALDYVINQRKMTAIVTIWYARPVGIILPESTVQLRANFTHHQNATISFSAANQVQNVTSVFMQVVRRYQPIYSNRILGYLPVFNEFAETEYAQGKSDYSNVALSEYRKQSIGPTVLESSAIAPHIRDYEIDPIARNQDMPVFTDQFFYLFRHHALTRIISLISDSLHKFDTKARLFVQFGSIWDMPVYRGTLLFPKLCMKADAVIVDDAPKYNHPFSMDYLSSSIRNIPYGNEIDGPRHGTDSLYFAQARQSVEHGASFVFVANWSADSMGARKALFQRVRNDLIDKAILPPPITDTLSISTSEVFSKGTKNYIRLYDSLSKRGTYRIYLPLIDDISNASSATPRR